MATIVIVHGAGTGGWLWQGVRRRLQAAGHEAFTPTLTGAGERAHLARPDVDLSTHILDIEGVLVCEDLRDVVLVGHSYGGMVIAGVAERAPSRLARLVYVDAFVPTDGQCLLDFVPQPVRESWDEQLRTVGDGWRLPPLPFASLGRVDADGLPEEQIHRLLERRTSQPVRTYQEPVRLTNPAARAIPRSFVSCVDKTLPDPFAHGARAARSDPGWDYHELATGHFPMLTTPRALTDLLGSIAEAS